MSTTGNRPTRYAYELDVTVQVTTTRGYYPEQPIVVSGYCSTSGEVDEAALQASAVEAALDQFVRESPGYTRNALLYQVDNKRWSLVTGGVAIRFEITGVEVSR